MEADKMAAGALGCARSYGRDVPFKFRLRNSVWFQTHMKLASTRTIYISSIEVIYPKYVGWYTRLFLQNILRSE